MTALKRRRAESRAWLWGLGFRIYRAWAMCDAWLGSAGNACSLPEVHEDRDIVPELGV